MFLGYNTNGTAHHNIFDAILLLAEIGYKGVAITIDHGVLAPHDMGRGQQLNQLKKLLTNLGLRSTIETGARFLLDSHVKHEPTLVSTDPHIRIDFYKYAIDCAAALGSDCVSIWSGTVRDDISPDEAMKRLTHGLHQVLDYAAGQGVFIALEPEPGMLIDSTRRYQELLQLVDSENLRLTLDVGHLQCQGETPIADVIFRWAPRLASVHIDDMKTGIHEHLMFGEGEIDFKQVISALSESGYEGGLYVELNRHSHEAPQAAHKAFIFLSRLLPDLMK